MLVLLVIMVMFLYDFFVIEFVVGLCVENLSRALYVINLFGFLNVMVDFMVMVLSFCVSVF